MDSNNVANKLKAMLEDPAALETISSILGSMQSGGLPTPSKSDSDSADEVLPASDSTPNNQAEAFAKIKQALDQVNLADDPRINLLNSLKPYMRANRLNKMDQAIRIIQISKMANLFKP